MNYGNGQIEKYHKENLMKANWFDRQIYKLFYWRWNPKLAKDPVLRQVFIDHNKLWTKEIGDISDMANDYAIKWERTSSKKTTENLAKVFQEIIEEIRNSDPRCK